VLRRVQAERAVGLNYGQRALMLGAAHPVNFIGTQENTRSGARPFTRLTHTASVFETVFFGTRSEADQALAFVERLHQRVRGELTEAAGPYPAGTSYTAFDPALMLWTIAVMVDSAEAYYETFVRELSPAEKQGLWRDYLLFGELFGMARDAAPQSYGEFREYWEAIWTGDQLHLTAKAREVALAIAFEIPLPLYLHPQREIHNLVLVGTLPQRARELFGLAWTPLHRAAFRAVVGGLRAARSVTPRSLRRGPNTSSFELVAQTEKQILAGGGATFSAAGP